MSEVKSAREVSERILDRAIDFDLEVYDIKQMISIILSDRRAIIEKCKEAIIRQASGHYVDLDGINYALDSVLSDLEKEE
jgi:hypothetical protein